MIIPIEPTVAFQDFTIQLGDYKMRFVVSWVTRPELFRVDIYDVTDQELLITAGRVLNLGVNLLEGLIDAEKYGELVLIGQEATLENIGSTAALNWVEPNA